MKRTDLAAEARQLWQESADQTTKLTGVAAKDYHRRGVPITQIEILNEQGSQALGKPIGNYLTLDLRAAARDGTQALAAAKALSEELLALTKLRKKDKILIIGLGNAAVTPDALGPKVLENLLITRHLVEKLPEHFGSFRQVSALAPGVLATTGLESLEIVKGVCAHVAPDQIIVIDALASRALARVCTSVQLTDTGIVPGSGVGNHRERFCRESLGAPVTAIGVPTVVDAATLVADAMGMEDVPANLDLPDGMVVTPSDIDARISFLAGLIGKSLNSLFHANLSEEELNLFRNGIM
ncbi:MAG: GPR endopeptidase [Oscillospiraceae bacterium]|nr:GPR endopeptidase [Oscillospiraceae bacterium]